MDSDAVWMGSLNALSFGGETGEIMHRLCDEKIVAEYEKVNEIPHVFTVAQQRQELECPICHSELVLQEGEHGKFWRCVEKDYSRSIDQPFPHDGVFRCHCGGEYEFFIKNEPRWQCATDPKHFQKMRYSDLKLEKMAEKTPTKKARREVEKYFKERKTLQGLPESQMEESVKELPLEETQISLF